VANSEELIRELDRIQPPPGQASAVQQPSQQATEPAPQQPLPVAIHAERSGLMWIIFGAVVLAAGVIGGGYLVYRARQVPPPPPPASVRSFKPEMKPEPAPEESKPPPAEPVAAPEPVPRPEEPPVAAHQQIPVPSMPAPPPPAAQPPRTVGVRDPEIIKVAEFVATEAEPATLNSKDRLTLTAQQNVYFSADYPAVAGKLEAHVGQPIELKGMKAKLWVMKCTPVEAALAVRLYRLTADPRAGFQFDRAPLQEILLKPTEQGYWLEFDLSEEVKRSHESGQNFGLVLMTSQGGEAVFGSFMQPDQKHWPTVDMTFLPAQ
jgi:hypothetical protein